MEDIVDSLRIVSWEWGSNNKAGKNYNEIKLIVWCKLPRFLLRQCLCHSVPYLRKATRRRKHAEKPPWGHGYSCKKIISLFSVKSSHACMHIDKQDSSTRLVWFRHKTTTCRRDINLSWFLTYIGCTRARCSKQFRPRGWQRMGRCCWNGQQQTKMSWRRAWRNAISCRIGARSECRIPRGRSSHSAGRIRWGLQQWQYGTHHHSRSPPHHSCLRSVSPPSPAPTSLSLLAEPTNGPSFAHFL